MMWIVRKIGTAVIIGIFFTGTAAAFEWPASNPRLVSTFGQSRWGDYLKGVEIYSEDSGIEPVDSGEIIFSSMEDPAGPHRFPSGLGNMAVVQHDRGIRSVYGHLANPVDSSLTIINQNQLIGEAGSSGMVEGRFLYLQIIDSEVARYVNPLLSLPSVTDRVRPNIEDMVLSNSITDYPLRNGMRIRQGNYVLRMRVYDMSAALDTFRPMAVYSVKLYINGELRQAFSFESLAVENWRTVPAGRSDLSHQILYGDSDKISLGSVVLQPGEASIEVVAADFAGNESIRTTRVQVAAE